MANQGAKYEVPTEMRDMAEKSVEQAKKAFGGFMTAAQKAAETLEGSVSTMQSSASDAARKTLGYAEQNLSAAFEHAQKLVRAKDMQEAMQIQTDYVRGQFAALQGQMKEFGELAQSTARSATNQAASAASELSAHARAATEQVARTVTPDSQGS